ncbi:Endoglucanase A-like 3 [Homarus americanus]|uniref:Endoglucanase n=1 Tax=Homarus americanus TaxID=6706 RepID=A0A8J5MJG4_HOMAM|nr:Endoglucanase A-like 3 [Homarus americanus]
MSHYWLIWTTLVVTTQAPVITAAVCGGTFLAANGTLTSPNYPKGYPPNQSCVYKIMASSDARLKLSCDKIDLETSLGCTKDYLRVNDLYTCGENQLTDMYGEGKLTLEFVSDKSAEKSGFKCSYKRVTGSDYVGQTRRKREANYNYDEVIRKSLLFYEAQRSGHLPTSQRVTWRKDSAVDDAIDDDTKARVDLEGGYYDGEMAHLKEAIKWGTDYFMKAHTSPNVFYGQVGNSELDHSYWGRPEDMTMYRPAYKLTEDKPGSDLAGETSAALAAASIVFKEQDASYSEACLTHAKELYNFGDSFRGKYSDSITDAVENYGSWGYYDELAWAAIWLFRATSDRSYLTKAKEHYSEIDLDAIGEFSWDEKTPGVQVLLATLTDSEDRPKYRQDLETFCNKMINDTPRTPKGLVFIRKWGSLRYAANVAMICLMAADLGINTQTYRQFGQEQIHYILGSTGRSFVVGYGVNSPQRPHHASSSCPNPPATCSWEDFDSPGPNPHVLYGAMVGGPYANDEYSDDRNDYVRNEVTCDFNAGFQTAVAALKAISDVITPSNVTTPVTSNLNSPVTINSANYQLVEIEQWEGNYLEELILTVPFTTDNWTMELTFSDVIDNFQVWDANVSPTHGTIITLTNKYYNGNQSQGAKLTFEYWVTYSSARPTITSIKLYH